MSSQSIGVSLTPNDGTNETTRMSLRGHDRRAEAVDRSSLSSKVKEKGCEWRNSKPLRRGRDQLVRVVRVQWVPGDHIARENRF